MSVRSDEIRDFHRIRTSVRRRIDSCVEKHRSLIERVLQR
jgi:hypothetical protein